MRLTFLALFFFTGAIAISQVVPAPRIAASPAESQGGVLSWTNCRSASPDLLVPGAVLWNEKGFSTQPKKLWFEPQTDATSSIQMPLLGTERQINSKKDFHWTFSNFQLGYCTPVALDGDPGLYQRLFRPIVKLGPIPTPWPHARLDKISITWPNLKMVPIASQPTVQAMPKAPLR
ncbi:MAG: hypothetical protein P4K94_06420 [Terracidiphilus sp.]|nr:hypothetical protein [Terracidiphilus sp.]